MAGIASTLKRKDGMTERERRTLSFVLAWALLGGMVEKYLANYRIQRLRGGMK